MTDTPTARKVGRPATGRDPVVSIRVPKRLTDEIEATARYTESPAAQVYREALYLGLQAMKGERLSRGEYLELCLRPKHYAEMHEAGHAVAMFLCAQELGWDAAEVVVEVALKRRQSGHMLRAVSLPPDCELRMLVAGAVAQAVDERVSFLEVWNGSPCRSDRKKAATLLRRHEHLSIERAAERMKAKFEDPDIWDAVTGLARRLIVNGKVSGDECWEIYSGLIEEKYESQRRASEHMGPLIDEDVVKRRRPRRVAKKKPRSRR